MSRLDLMGSLLAHLDDSGPKTCTELAEATGQRYGDVYVALRRLHDEVAVCRVKVAGEVLWWTPALDWAEGGGS